MSENTNDMNEVFEEELDDSTVITVPIDDTLSNSGEAADAKAVGDALALKADKSELAATVSVNGQEADNQGKILVDGTDIPMSTSDSTTLKEAIEAAAGRNGEDIPVSDDVGAQTIAEALEAAGGKSAADIPMSDTEGAPSIAAKISAMDVVANANSNAITALQGKAGDTIPLVTGGIEKISEAIAGLVKTVNGDGPDANGNVQVTHAVSADNLTSSQSQTSIGSFIRRPSGGTASISDGPAWIGAIRGDRIHNGYVPEVLNMTVTPAARGEGETPITAELDRDTFVAYVENTSGTYTLTFTTSWSANPALYGVTVTGDPVSGDQITISFTAEDRGTIIQSDPQSFVSTGYNLYNHTLGYCIGIKYSNSYGFRIAGTYTAVKYAATLTGTKQTILPVDGAFDIPADGYIFVEGGNSTDTEVYMTWADWQLGRSGVNWAAYTENVIDLSSVMETMFPYGLLRVGDVRDEINFNTGRAVSNVQRLAYSAENLATAKSSGRTWEADTDYIYLEKASADSTAITLDGDYTANDHGIEYYTGTDYNVYTIVIYGNNLKNKLERNVLTISQQTLSTSEQAQVQSNIGAASSLAMAALAGTVTDNANFKLGDVITLPLFNAGYAAKATEVRFYVTLPKKLPQPSTDHIAFQDSITISLIRKADGTSVNVPDTPSITVGRSSDYVLQIAITNVSGCTQYAEYFALFDGSNRTVTIVEDNT